DIPHTKRLKNKNKTSTTQANLYKITPKAEIFKVYLGDHIGSFSNFTLDSKTLWFLNSKESNLTGLSIHNK
ncbi:hypothetical protein, partial [Helicobacter sp. MIT 14-3879]|uniref:hypothetical protein n=1 Tax=Helicobacter sp. MIT 14-3879 TaxID=2040649 RepID=UPI000E375780